jgi:hypothetical protein
MEYLLIAEHCRKIEQVLPYAATSFCEIFHKYAAEDASQAGQ